MKAPELRPIDLEGPWLNNHEHPEIRTDSTQYLCLIDGRYFCGRFSRVWFGLNFHGWINPVGLQLDRPGTNISKWQAIWEIVR